MGDVTAAGSGVADLPPLADLLAVHHATEGQASAIEDATDRTVDMPGWTVGLRDLQGATATLPTRQEPVAVLDGTDEPDPLDRTEVVFGEGGGVRLRRSASGRVPLYVAVGAGRVAVATRLELLALVMALRSDPVALWSWCSGVGHVIDGRCVVDGVTRVAPGEQVVVASSGSLDRSQLWRPWDQAIDIDTPASFAEAAAAFGRRLVDVVDRELPRDGTLLTASGGVDSTVLAFLAGHLGRRTSGLTLRSPRPAHAAQQESVLARLGEESPTFTGTTWVPLSAASRVALTDAATPSWLPTLHPALNAIAQRGLQPVVVLGGEAADELVGSSSLSLGDWRRHIGADIAMPWRWPRTRRVVRALTGLGRSGRGRIPVGAEPPEDLAGGAPDDIREAYVDWRRRGGWRPGAVPLPGLTTTVRADLWLDMNWEALAPSRVRRVTPFRDRQLIELAFRIHPRFLFDAGRDKGFLSAAMIGLVPDWVLQIDGKSTAGPAAPVERVRQPSDAGVQQLRRTLGLPESWDPRPLRTHEDARTLAALTTVPEH